MAIVIDRVTYDYNPQMSGKKLRSEENTALLRASALNGVSLTIGEGEFFDFCLVFKIICANLNFGAKLAIDLDN